ncbi:MAG: 2-amino-4-hydroxy-6-hydroxymethyldihydropteridine diphosphokinase [Deltaproteobacteria bacterium]|nr:2-amino-4-hydroxy-6-hydroxymethyldihydropteridine diphosphokinase [Deltaproteobacteria bacterium]
MTVYIGLGGNLGDVLQAFRVALAALGSRGVEVEEVAAAFRTAAVVPEGCNEDVPDYWNSVARATTRLSPRALLELLLALEAEGGRERGERWRSRPLDLDLLLYGDRVIHEPGLVVPHPEIVRRAFVLRPLCELDPEVPVPNTGRSAGALLAALADRDAGVLYRLTGWRRPPG